jgi:GNAT superfamily N-acetyltransferase
MEFEIFEAPRDMKRLVMDLSKNVYSVPMSKSEFKWKYFENPAGEAKVWFAKDKTSGLVCGSWSLFPWYMTIGGEEVLCAQAGDLMVLPEFRKKGLFRSMVKTSIGSLRSSNIRALIAFPETVGQSYEGFVKFAWKNPTFLRTHKRLLRMTHFTKDISRTLSDKILKPITLLYNINHIIRSKVHRNIRFEKIDLFDEKYDELFNEHFGAPKAFVSRRSRYLNWKFIKHPKNNYVAYCLSKLDKILGYIILQCKEKEAYLVDIYPPTDKHVVRLLISFTVGLLLEKGEDILICACSDDIGSYLKNSGFIQREISLQFVMHIIDSSNNSPLYSPSKQWTLISGDVDVG